MKRIYETLAYSDYPICDNYWASTIQGTPSKYYPIKRAIRAEFAIVGGVMSSERFFIPLTKLSLKIEVRSLELPRPSYT